MGELTVAAVSNRHAHSTLSRMKYHLSSKATPTRTAAGGIMSASACLAAFVLALAPAAATGQSATNFDTKALTPEAPVHKEEKAAKPISKVAPSGNNTPSRQVGPAELETYVASLASTFSIRERTTDPFGQVQDPDAKPVIKTPVAGTIKRIAPVQATPFADIIRLLVVTTIMPGEKRFLIGTRSFKLGDQIPLSFRGKQIRVQITEVTAQQIAFKNLENGDLASRKLDMLPVGMTPGSRGITAPGMTLDRPNAPIELETVESAP